MRKKASAKKGLKKEGKQAKQSCCEQTACESLHPDHSRETHRLNRIQGQIEGIRRMITAREYCPKIIIQISAVRAALRSLESSLLKCHLENCVQDAFLSKDEQEMKSKVDEILEVFRRA